MKWRLREGHGEAIYEIGVEDSGLLTGLSNAELTASLDTLRSMAKKLGATTTVLRERVVENGRQVAEVLVRKVSRYHIMCESYIYRSFQILCLYSNICR